MTDRVKCIECDRMILPQTAANNEGLCGRCVKISPELRAEIREYERRLAAGLVFTPCERERATASIPKELTTGQWQLQPDYYDESDMDSAIGAIASAKSKNQEKGLYCPGV